MGPDAGALAMLPGYQRSEFTAPVAGGHVVTHDVYRKGAGPAVVIVQVQLVAVSN